MSAECLISAKVEFGATVLINSAVALFLLRFFAMWSCVAVTGQSLPDLWPSLF
jgi:hypothetical protein